MVQCRAPVDRTKDNPKPPGRSVKTPIPATCLRAAVLLAAVLVGAGATHAQTSPLWEASEHFQYNILNVAMTTRGSVRSVTVDFSVTDPRAGNDPWDVKADTPYTLAGATLRILVGWSTTDYHNTGSANPTLTPVPFGNGGTPAAGPISVNALSGTAATPLGNGVYRVSRALPSQAAGTGIVAMEGHPMWPNPVVADPPLPPVPVPVKSAYHYFAITDPQPIARRQIVDFDKCQACHNGRWNSRIEQVIPRLTLHGSNRTEEPAVCVICHNPNQTDIAYRTSGEEVSVDFKSMIHAIHGNKRREEPLVVVGFRGSIVDFGDIEFPANPRDCFRCHIDQNGKGTYELPLAAGVQGTTINTGSIPGVSIDVDPANNLRITPTAAVCSSCHDSPKALEHMASRRSGGAFGVLQSQIDSLAVKENCVSCHGPGKDKSVRKVHR